MLTFQGCSKTEKQLELRDLDQSRLLSLRMYQDGNRFLFKEFSSCYFYFVAGGCSACLDEELAKINTHNQSASMSDQIHIVSDKEDVLNRIGHFVDKTQLYKIRLGFAESNFMIQKIDNTLYMSSLEAALASDDIQ